MNNGETNGTMPAYPAMDMNSHMGVDRLELRYAGLTKRELIAAMIASGKSGDPKHIAEHAIWVADELLKQLEQKP